MDITDDQKKDAMVEYLILSDPEWRRVRRERAVRRRAARLRARRRKGAQ